MCSPKYLKESYWPHSKYALEPFVKEGIRLIHHCDGNVMPIIDDMIDVGYTGFQGFQYECNVDPYELAARRGPNGEHMLFMAGLSVTRTLPFGNVDEVKDEIEYCMDYTDGGKGLFLFTSNVVGIEVPPINLKTAYHHAASINPASWKPQKRDWPWSLRESKTLLK
jgi:uroporphyrinogen decarboxylase